MMGDLPKWKRKEWSHSYGWPTQGEEWPHYHGWPTQVKKNGEWSHSNGWPTQKKNDGLIMMGDLPKWKKMWKTVSLWWVTYPNGKNVKCGLIMMGDLPKWKECEVRSHYNGWPTQMEDGKNMKWSHCYGWPTQVEDRKKWSGRVIMGDLPRWKIEKIWSGLIVMGDLPRWKDGGLIVMGDLPRKNDAFSLKKNGLIVTGDLPKDRMWLTWQKDLVGAVLTGQGWETWHLLVAGWLEDSLMTRLISLFLWDSPTGRVHLILFSFQDLNRFFHHQLNDSFFVHNLAGLHWGSFCNKS